MNRMMKAGAASLLLVGLGACSGVVVDDLPGPRYNYFDGDFEYATRDGAIVTVITGNTFGMPKAQFDKIVLDNMQGQNRGPPARFVATPEKGKTDPLYKVVVAFNPAKSVSGWEMCKDVEKTPTDSTIKDNAEMAIAFCIRFRRHAEIGCHGDRPRRHQPDRCAVRLAGPPGHECDGSDRRQSGAGRTQDAPDDDALSGTIAARRR